MKKYLISTLTAAAALAAPAFSAELIGSWDFSSMTTTTEGLGSVQSSVSYDGGESYLTLVSGSNIAYGGAGTYSGYYLNITTSSDTSHKTTIDVSNADVTLDGGLSIVLTITTMSGSGGAIYAAIGTDKKDDAAAIGESSATEVSVEGNRGGFFMANGSSGSGNITTESGLAGIDLTYPYTITLVFEGDTMYIYQNDVIVAQGDMTSTAYDAINGSINEIAIGSWYGTSTSSELNLGVVSMDIYRGNIYAAPEPSMFGLFFGLGAIGLVATRRRRR